MNLPTPSHGAIPVVRQSKPIRIALFAAASIAVASAIGTSWSFLAGQRHTDPIEVASRRDPSLGERLRAMQVSATLGNWEHFSRHVDVVALRNSVREMTRRELARSQKKGEVDAIEVGLSDLLAGVLLERYLTHETLPKVMRAFSLAMAVVGERTKEDPAGKTYGYFVDSELFIIAREKPGESTGAYLVFGRQGGSGWQLTGMTDKRP